ncbi:MAG: suppressor of fused domain protein, partial [Mycobacterium sp.]|nr:suppressor of fused domain protein [Mycobacterium sp.]
MSSPLDLVGAHLRTHFAAAGVESEPEVASVTFLGVERIDVLRFGPDDAGVYHHVSLGCSRYPMTDAGSGVVDPVRGPRAEIVLSLRGSKPITGLARSVAVLAATPAVDGVVLVPDALVDLSGPLWTGAPFTAVLLGESEIAELALDPPADPVRFL